ncbi:MAG: hypothetical protein ACREPR_05005, partial [Brasilonema sp.]
LLRQGYFILNVEVVWYNTEQLQVHVSTPMSQPAIIEAFAELEDRLRNAGQRHTLPLCPGCLHWQSPRQ